MRRNFRALALGLLAIPAVATAQQARVAEGTVGDGRCGDAPPLGPLGAADDGIDVEMPTGPDPSDLDAYVTRALDPREAPSYGVPGDR